MAATIFRYDNAGRTIGILPYDSATHTEALDGTDKLVVVSEDSPTKRDRLVWQDESGLWHEHMVDATRRTHGAGGARTESTCSNSINELYGVIVNWTKIRTRIEDVIATILSGTTWYIGDCSNFGVVEMELYHKSARECLAELCELVHGELETFVTVGDSGVVRRYLRIVRERGRKSVMRQFQYSRNISSIVREVTSDEVYTAVKGYGAKLVEYDTNEYPTRLEATVNSNMDLTRWGVPMGNGTFAHNYTTYTDAQCTDRTFLTKQCQSILSSVSKPLVRYEFDTVDAGDGLWSDVRLGDKVMCIDEQFNPSLELIERVSEIRRNLKGRMQCRIVIGARTNPLVDKFKSAEKVGLKSTGNPSRITAVSPVSTLGAGYDGESAVGIGDVPTPTVTEPSRIAVTTPPTKTTYYEGERIDFTGIVVTLYNTDGSVYTDEWHPDGVAAFEELSFSSDVAAKGDMSTSTVVTNGGGLVCAKLDTARNKVNIASNVSVFNYDERFQIGMNEKTGEAGELYGPVLFGEGGRDNTGIYYLTVYNGVIYATREDVEDARYWGNRSTGKLYPLMLEDRKPFYWGFGGVVGNQTGGRWKYGASVDEDTCYIPVSTVDPLQYGDVDWKPASSDIVVSWTRQDGVVLQTSFQINLAQRYFQGDSWGGGEGIDVPASSGGGKF